MIDKLNTHYSLTNPATVYDEEALTTLKLVGRHTAKINEVIEDQNNLKKETENHLNEQDSNIEKRLNNQDANIENIRTKTVPADVKTEVTKRIQSGEFDKEINDYIGNLEDRVDNLLNNTPEGSTTMDAEVIDIRTRFNGEVYNNAGNVVRTIDKGVSELTLYANGGEDLFNNEFEKCYHWGSKSSKSVAINESGLTWYYNEEEGEYGDLGVVIPIKKIDEGVIRVKWEGNSLSGTPRCTIWVSQNPTYVSGQCKSCVSVVWLGGEIEISTKDLGFEPKYLWLVMNTDINTYPTMYAKITMLKVYYNELKDYGFKGTTVREHLIELKDTTDNQLNAIGIDVLANDFSQATNVFSTEPLVTKDWASGEGDTIIVTGVGDRGVAFNNLKVDTSKMVRVVFDLEIVNDENEVTAEVIVANDFYNSQAKKKSVATVRKNGHYEFTVDPAFYSVYEGFDIKCVMIFTHIKTATESTMTLSNIKIYQSKLEDNDIPTELEDALIHINKGEVVVDTKETYLVSPNGDKFVSQVNSDGSFVAVPVIPNKALFIGNSLLFGFGTFGMAASNSKLDYYYLFNDAVKGVKSEYTSTKLGGSTWEGLTSVADQNTWLNDTLLPALSNDLDLVIIQLGDNVNTDEKKAVFEEGCLNFLKFVRTHCPKARVVWMGAWYQNAEKQGQMLRGCKNTGSTFIDIWDIHTSGNENAVGNTWTADDGTVNTITSSGVASHPNDNGFKAIANRMLYNLGIVDTESYYS